MNLSKVYLFKLKIKLRILIYLLRSAINYYYFTYKALFECIAGQVDQREDF